MQYAVLASEASVFIQLPISRCRSADFVQGALTLCVDHDKETELSKELLCVSEEVSFDQASDMVDPKKETVAVADINEMDNALRMLWCVLSYGSSGIPLSHPKLNLFECTIMNHPDLVVVTQDETGPIVYPAIFDGVHSKVSRLRQYRGRRRAAPWTPVPRHAYETLVATLKKIEEMAGLTWTFTYPVPREVFTLFLTTFEAAKKLPAAIRLDSKYGPSVCCLIECFEVTPTWVRYRTPAQRFTNFSSPDCLCPKDFFYDFIGLMDSDGVDANLVVSAAITSDDRNLKMFNTLENVRMYLARNLPNELDIKDGRMKVVDPGMSTTKGKGHSDAFGSPADEPPASREVAAPAKGLVDEDEQSHQWEPTSPLEALNFLGLRIWAFKRWPECREFGLISNPGISFDAFVAQMRDVMEEQDDWQTRARRFVETYEGFHLQGGRLFPVSPETILYPSTKLHLLVYVEDICKKLRTMVKLPTSICQSLHKVEDRSLISPLDRCFSNTFNACRIPKPVRIDVPRVPLSELNTLISELPQEDQEQVKGIFPGSTLLRQLPLISVLTAYPILTTSDEWLLT